MTRRFRGSCLTIGAGREGVATGLAGVIRWVRSGSALALGSGVTARPRRTVGGDDGSIAGGAWVGVWDRRASILAEARANVDGTPSGVGVSERADAGSSIS